mgnify:FL=1
MKKIIYYLRDYGLFETIKRIFTRILGIIGLIESETYVLRFQLAKASVEQPYNNKFRIIQLHREHVREFNRMKYFDFIDGNKMINSKHSKIFVAMDDNKIIGYVCCHTNTEHSIYRMGTWKLKSHEAWVGPSYVIRDYRNKKVNRLLWYTVINEMNKLRIDTFYTAINKNNEPSLKSVINIGFSVIGIIKFRKLFGRTINKEIIDFNKEKELTTKFNKF